MEKALATYTAVLLDLTPEQIVQAFSRAAAESKFFPAPATLREYSGRPPSGDPICQRSPRGVVQNRGVAAYRKV
jgi:hypothetical protein